MSDFSHHLSPEPRILADGHFADNHSGTMMAHEKYRWWVRLLLVLGWCFMGFNVLYADNGRRVVAVTMSETSVPWYSDKWRYWQFNHHQPVHKDANGRRDIGSNYYPAIGLFDDSDPEYIEYACQLLAMAEVDAITAHHNDSFKNEWHNQAARKWFPILKRYGLKDAPRGGGDGGAMVLEKDYKLFQPDILTISNRGVYVFFSIKMPDADIAAWKNTYPADQRPFIIRVFEATGRKVGASIDGAYGWVAHDTKKKNDNSRPGYVWANDAEQAKSGYENEVARARRYIADGELHWYADGVSPGFNDQAVNGWGGGPRYIERANGETYRYRWQRACENGFPAVFIPTWDDWGEGSMIAPTVEFGNQYLEITRTYAAKYKGIPPNHGNFDVPKWIYTIRKRTDDPQILTAMKQACDLMQQRKYAEAEAFVLPYVKALQITSLPTYWEWTAQHRVK